MHALLLPHPAISRRSSSLLSINTAASPRTPRSCGSPANSILVPQLPNRKSSDSWNSSNADDLEWEWKPDQILLLSRTLDALPAHLVTPFNGPIPPNNLLDKIARGVSQAKGPVEWPHSLRATRVKLIELSRLRAKEQAANQRRESIAEEPEDAPDSGISPNYSYSQTKRPLYRQSSMDFMLNATGIDIKNNEHLARLSSRLQRAERQASHHPYQRAGRSNECTSPPASSTVPSLISPSTPSSSTLNTLSSVSIQRRNLRRTVSSASSSSLSIISSSSSESMLPNPRVQRLMQDDAFVPVLLPKDTPTKTSAKRAPSFGALAQGTKRECLAQSPDGIGHTRKNSGTYPSSDEEEKIRNKQAKKARKHSICTPSKATATPPPESPAAPMTPYSPITIRRSTASKLTELKASTPREAKTENRERTSKDKKENILSPDKGSKTKTKPLPMNLHRNPSMFGPELPPIPSAAPQLSLAPVISSRLTRSPSPAGPTRNAPRSLASSLRPSFNPSPPALPSPATSLLNPPADINIPASPSPKTRTLRRVRRLPAARRISFSSIAVPPGDYEADADGEGDGEEKIELGSAFQLQ